MPCATAARAIASDASMSGAPSSMPGKMCEWRSITGPEASRRALAKAHGGVAVGGRSYDVGHAERLAALGDMAAQGHHHRRLPGIHGHDGGRIGDAGQGLRGPTRG